ncbi:MAG: DUF58 domain-containing protein [Eubacterium sp.]|nr:DUF58 domain-containing protein [Eubacterium sp.]
MNTSNMKNNTEHKIFNRKRLPLYIYLLLLILATVNVSLRGGAFSYIMFYVLLLYLPVSAIYILYSAIALSFFQETEHKLFEKATAEKYNFMVENTGRLPIGGLKFYYDDKLMKFTDDFTGESFSLSSKERKEIDTYITVKYAGSYDVGISAYSVQDMFGIITWKFRIKLPVRISVLPFIKILSDDEIRRMNELQKGGNRFSINTPEENLGNDIRKYIPGDRLSDVHWKNYARTGEMYVRIPEKQDIDILCIAAVTEALDGSIEMMEKRDSFLEYLVSVGNYFGMNKKPFVLYYYNAGVQSYLIDSPVSFREFYSNVPDRVGQKTAAGHEKEILEVASNSFTSIILFLEDGCVFKEAYDDQQ